MHEEKPNKEGNHIFIAGVIFCLLFGAVNAALNLHPSLDSSMFYIPAVRAFGAGDYAHAFHHAIPPLMTILAGTLAKAGLSAWVSVNIINALLWTAALFPLRRIAYRMLGSMEQAQWCCLLYVSLGELTRWIFVGCLEPPKVFFLLFVVDQLMAFHEKGRIRNTLLIGLGTALLGLTRNECIAFFPIILFFMLLTKTNSFGRRIASVAVVLAVCALIWTPFAVPVHKLYGIPAFTSKQAFAAHTVLRKMGVKTHIPIHEPQKKAINSAPENTTPKPTIERQSAPIECWQLNVRIMNTFKGGVIYLTPLWLIGIALRIIKRKWSYNDSLCVTLYAFNIAVIWIFIPYTVPRYFLSVVPLLLPFATEGILFAFWLFGFILRLSCPGRKLIYPASAALLIVCGIWGLRNVRHSLDGDYDAEVEVGRWIKNHAEIVDVNPPPVVENPFSRNPYFNGADVGVACIQIQIAIWADAHVTQMQGITASEISDLLVYLKYEGADVLVVDDELRDSLANIMPKISKLPLLKTFPQYNIEIYSVASE